METKFNFKSAVCTSREQSERLLALGLKPETADMAYKTIGKVVDMGEVRWMYQHNPSVVYKGIMTEEDIPAWSMHRLIEMMPESIEHKVYGTLWRTIYANDVFYTDWKDNTPVARTLDLYEHLIFYIEWLIKEGYFNKQYLEEYGCC